jgi:hypothetical protein
LLDHYIHRQQEEEPQPKKIKVKVQQKVEHVGTNTGYTSHQIVKQKRYIKILEVRIKQDGIPCCAEVNSSYRSYLLWADNTTVGV